MKKSYFFVIYIFLSLGLLFPVNLNIRAYDHKDFTRVVFEGDRSFGYDTESSSGNDLLLKINGVTRIDSYRTDLAGSEFIDKIEYLPGPDSFGFRVRAKKHFKIAKNFVLEKPFRVVYDITPDKDDGSTATVGKTPAPGDQEETAPPSPVLKENITIDTICIDPGHGGTDLGAVGKSGVKEKDITLAVARRLRNRIEKNLGLRVIMTRDSDVEVALDSRVSKANNQKAQLFLSIHVNSSFRRSARGPETYYVSLKATDQASYNLAQKENGSGNGFISAGGDDGLKMILWSMAQSEFIKESSKLADYIQYELNIVMNTVNRGVKQAPFRVLMRASMPAVLVEIAFVSNKYEEQKLTDESFLDTVSNAIYKGVSKFIYYYNNRFK